MQPVVKLIRKVSFSSGHRFWNDKISPEQNRALFGKFASPYNHGHNYTLHVAVEGAVNPQTGMVVNIKDIDQMLQDRVVAKFDMKSLNDEVAGFDSVSPTLENLLAYLRRELATLEPGVRLVSLKLEELPTLSGEWNVNNPNEVAITRTYEFAAAHRLHMPELSDGANQELFGKCNNPSGHGHNYVLEVTVSGVPDPKSGMIVNILDIDSAVNREVVERYDHKHLNLDVPEFQDKNPTSEVIALEVFRRLEGKVGGKLKRVRLFETARSAFEVCASD